jgi:T4 RnlA family RNA ligase
MKLTNLPSEDDGFKHYPIEFCGIDSYLIIPAIDAKWNKQNLIYRSLIVRGSDLEVLSSGFPKFFNAGEKPDAYPDPENFKDWKINDKIDGSLVIVDYVNDQFSMRTRGTACYSSQANWADFEQLAIKYPHVMDALKNNQDLSFLFEIVTPNNIIVVPYAEIDFIFLGAVDKKDCSLLSFNEYQEMGKLMDVPMPEIRSFGTLCEMLSEVKNWKGREGVVLSYNDNNSRVKIKSDDYCLRHRTKSELNSESNFVDLYVHEGMPDYQEFFKIIERLVDFETATAFRGRISKVVDAGKEVKRIIEGMQNFVKDFRNLPRKEAAMAILGSYGNTNRSAFAFAILDQKPLTNDQIVKLFWQTLKLN